MLTVVLIFHKEPGSLAHGFLASSYVIANITMMIANAAVQVCVSHRSLMIKCENFALIFVETCRSHSYVTADVFP